MKSIWFVGVYEKPIRGRVTHNCYSVIADDAEEAKRMARVEHEHEGLPETHGARYVAEEQGQIAKMRGLDVMSAKKANERIAAGMS